LREFGLTTAIRSHDWDVHGTSCFGLRHIWINGDDLPEERLPRPPVATIGSQEELPHLLQPVAEEEL
jgi:FMN phosphatase YigB (HAD superfamily)